MTVHDSAFPDLKDRAQVTITVTRNPNAPIFEPSATYFKQIGENTTVGTEIVDINARDADQVLLNHIFFLFNHIGCAGLEQGILWVRTPFALSETIKLVLVVSPLNT